jgi:cytidine deaminase
MTKAQWHWDRLYAAAVLSSSGKIYTGVCIDTCCTLGICAERNAIFNMLTNGEQEKVITLGELTPEWWI